MNKNKAFTLIELLVVIAIIALLMSILMPALTRVSDQAKNAVCKSNLHQFAIAWKIYLDDNKNRFPDDMGDWVWRLLEYYRDEGLLLCPYAKKTSQPVTQANPEIRGNAQFAWGEINDDDESPFNGRKLVASYGINQFCSSDTSDSQNRNVNTLFPNATVPFASKVPLMGDCAQKGRTPLELDVPPRWENDIYLSNPTNVDEIRSFCINRHNYAINMVFLDWSVKSVRLKELWILRWKKDWNLPPEPLPTAWDAPDHWMRDLPNPFL
jgi:prepilin-type N-terminal cleavage/methylation domain-containing protein